MEEILEPNFEEAIIEDVEEVKSFKDFSFDDIQVIDDENLTEKDDTKEDENSNDNKGDEIDLEDVDNTNDFVLSIFDASIVGFYDSKNLLNPSVSDYRLTKKEKEDLSRLSKKVLVKYNAVLSAEVLILFMLIGIFSKRALMKRNKMKADRSESKIDIIDITEDERNRTSFKIDSNGLYMYTATSREYIKEGERTESPSQFVLKLISKGYSSNKIKTAIDSYFESNDE